MKKSSKKILVIYGTRPEAIKLAPVILALNKSRNFDLSVCVTAQHREMLDQVNQLFDIKPDFDLDVMEPDQTPTDLSAQIYSKLPPIIEKANPEWVLVHGDTTTAMISAIISSYLKIKVGHIEAGLRTFTKWEPFPEEINRRIISTISDLHFCPTEIAYQNLLNEGLSENKLILTGNTTIDVQNMVLDNYDNNIADVVGAIHKDRDLVLVTIHRSENFGEPLLNICEAIKELLKINPNAHVVFPVHKNPNIDTPVRKTLGNHPRITLTPPLDYPSILNLLKVASFIMTDSGGIQEEAAHLGKSILVLREITERPETVEFGFAFLVGSNKDKIISEGSKLLDQTHSISPKQDKKNLYGSGDATEKILEALENYGEK